MSSFTSRYENNYVADRNLYDIFNSRQKQCLTIDSCDVNELGPAKFRTQADSGTEQISYYNRNKKDTCFNSLLAVGKQTSSPFEINVSIVNW